MVELYVSRVSLPGVTPPAIPTVPQPFTPGGDASSPIGQALSGAGAELSALGRRIRAAADEAQVARATTGYLTDLNDLETRYRTDADYQTSPQRFAADRADLEGRYLASVPASAQPQAQLTFRRLGLSSQNQVDGRALGQMADATAADLDRQEAAWLTRYASAASPAEREAARQGFQGQLSGPVEKGLITAQNAEARLHRFGALTDNADVLGLIRDRPDVALQTLADPKNYPNLDPVDIERLRTQAAAAQDEQAIAEVNNRARWDPARASAEVGRVASREQGDIVFERGIVPQESGVNPGWIGPPGGSPGASAEFLVPRLIGHGRDHVDGMRPELQDRLAALFQAAPPEIAPYLGITSGHRTNARQTQIWNAKVQAIAGAHPSWSQRQVEEAANHEVARPGGSAHEHGTGADLGFRGTRLDNAPPEVIAWVHQNAGRYGLKFPLGNENWHIELAETRGGSGPANLATMGPRPDLVSPKGALGVAQLMPGTARDMARALNMPEIAGLSDAALKERLLSDHALNLTLGRAYWRQMLDRYEGSVPLALAGYNAGPANADRWRAAAVAQYGPNFTAEQLASVIDARETRDYLSSVYGRLGAAQNGAGLSPGARWRGANQVADTIGADIRARHQTIVDIASFERSGSEWFEMAKRGTQIADNPNYLAYLATQQAAAATGDLGAREELRRLGEAERLGPAVTEALGMHPAELGAAIDNLRSALSGQTADSPGYRRLQAFEEAQQTVQAGVRDNPIALGERARLYTPIEALGASGGLRIDPNGDFAGAMMQEAMAYRGRQALANVAAYGAAPMPFKPAEATAIAERLRNASPAEAAGIFAGMARALPEAAYRAAVEQVAKDNPLAATAGRVALDRPDVAEKALRGAAILQSPGIEKPAAELRGALTRTLAGVLLPDGAQADIINLALAVYAADRGTNGTLWDANDQAAIERAVQEVAGESVSRNGRRFFAPPGVPASAAERVLDSLTAAEVDAAGGAVDASGAPWDPAALGAHAVLEQRIPFEPVYRLFLPTATGAPDGLDPVLRPDGQPFTLDLRALAAERGIAAEAARIEARRAAAAGREQRYQDLLRTPPGFTPPGAPPRIPPGAPAGERPRFADPGNVGINRIPEGVPIR